MSGKDVIAITALFPHDTQMATLVLAQRRLRAAFSRLAPESGLPFNFMLPFCPVFDQEETRTGSKELSRLTVGPAVAESGWIVAPVAGSPVLVERGPRSETKGTDRFPAIPGYPALPRSEGFILGYAGPLAQDVLAGAVAGERGEATPEGQSVLTATLSVRARYRARVELAIERDDRAYSVAFSIGPASWRR